LVFAAASLALVAASALGVLAGASISYYVSERMIHSVAGVGFIAIGIWVLFR
jgi:putative Ca2+/H+ antiporter (TMEM165/GDT1 family)